ncbi:glycosyl hydrolase family 18 protein [Geodermatophilus sp. URMC 63]
MAGTTADTTSTDTSTAAPTPGTTEQSPGDSQTPTGQWVLGYYVGYQISRYPIAEIDWSCLTHIAFAPLKVNTDGTLDLGFDDETGQGEAHAKELSAAARAHGVKSLLMLGGAGAGANIAQAATTENRAVFIGRLLTTMDELGYDGIDLDWEDHVVPADLVALAQGLREARPDMLLTYPGGTINSNIQQPSDYAELAGLAPYVDRFSVMSYTGTYFLGYGWESWFVSPLSGSGGPHPVTIDDSLQRWADVGVPKSKLMLGVGAFAICYPSYITEPRQTTFGNDEPGHEHDEITGGDNVFPLGDVFAQGGALDQHPGARRWDEVAQQPYLSLPADATGDGHCGQPSRYIPYDDEESINAKGKWSQERGYGGTIVWTVQQLRLPPGATGGKPRDALIKALRTGFLTPQLVGTP